MTVSTGSPVIGIIGIGRIGYAVAASLLTAGHTVVCCDRGRSAQLVAEGARIAGDGSPRAVAEASDVVFTCLPADGVSAIGQGPHGILAAGGRLPLVVEISTAPAAVKKQLREELLERDGDLLDCPISGTPDMVAARTAVLYASGDFDTYRSAAELLRVVSPATTYVGEVGAGTAMKYVANLLAIVHAAVTAEAMAFATALGLDPTTVAEVVARSPAATSGQFAIRAPLIAEERYAGTLVTVRDSREVLGQIGSAARDVGVSVPLTTAARRVFGQLGDEGGDDDDPAALAPFLRLRHTQQQELTEPGNGTHEGTDPPEGQSVARG